jgi:uncharacterized protein DUF5329
VIEDLGAAREESTFVRRLLLLLLLSCVPLAAPRAAGSPVPPAARAEIDALMARLEASGCEVNRNGSWYPAADAKAHLTKKLEYLENRGSVQSAEQFIELAASKSSVSGRPYLIKCGSAPPVASGTWLSIELRAVRASARGAGGGP